MNETTIYYFPIDSQGKETSDGIPVSLKDGAADVSRLPENVRSSLTAFGTPDATKYTHVFPKDGQAFLNALLVNANPYMRFRSTPDKRA